MMSIASSITSRLRRPRKSIFSRPSSSTGPIEYWVTILYWRSGLPTFPSALTGGGAGGGARGHLAEGDDLGDRLAAVFLGDVADHPLAAADREIDVDIRHRFAPGVEEALEDQAFGERVEVGDAEHVGDDRARRR